MSRVKLILCCTFIVCLNHLINCEPQLDLPNENSEIDGDEEDRDSVERRQQSRERGPRVLVLPNSYMKSDQQQQPKGDSSNGYDSDRSQRYGEK
jgi:hypothetical protein